MTDWVPSVNTSFSRFTAFVSDSSSSSVICQTTGPKPLPKRFLHIMRSRASSFNWQYPLLSLRSSSSFLCFLPRLLVTSICPFIFPSIICSHNILGFMFGSQFFICFNSPLSIHLCWSVYFPLYQTIYIKIHSTKWQLSFELVIECR